MFNLFKKSPPVVHQVEVGRCRLLIRLMSGPTYERTITGEAEWDSSFGIMETSACEMLNLYLRRAQKIGFLEIDQELLVPHSNIRDIIKTFEPHTVEVVET